VVLLLLLVVRNKAAGDLAVLARSVAALPLLVH
jgi:hypothetical protein